MLGLDARGAPVGTGVEQVLAVGPVAEIWAKRARVVVP